MPKGGRNIEPAIAEYLKTHEIQKSVRTVAICVTVVASIGLISWAAIRIAEKPPWLVLLLVLLGPSGVIIALIRTWRAYIRNKNRRLVELEQAIDQERSSSGLEVNGGSPDEF